ncbi:MAG: TAT-variant-translocated molybdopterin oxidoreductase [Gemmatimonadota bacterium]
MSELTPSRRNLDLGELRARLAAAAGPAYWRSLEEVAATPEFEAMLHREFPEQASEWSEGVPRRSFLRLMGASLALGGLTSCTVQPEEKIVPWVRAPENLVPGRPLFYATAVPVGGIGTGVLVESHQGRPTKIEGNPDHPSSLGGTQAMVQASVLDLYDPDRAQVVTNAVRISTWGDFLEALGREMAAQRRKAGAGLRLLTGRITSPTLAAQLQSLMAELPEARWCQYEAVHGDAARAGALLAFGEPVHTHYDLAAAEVVVSLDADFAYSMAGSARYARDFASRRRPPDGAHGDGPAAAMNRLYVVECTPSPTGAIADHRLALDPGGVEAFTVGLARALGVTVRGAAAEPASGDAAGWVGAVARDLQKHQGASVVIAGDHQAPTVHALAHAINEVLGNVGHTVHHTAPLEAVSQDQGAALAGLVAEMQGGKVEALLILGANPAYAAPGELDFAGAMGKVPFRAQLSLHGDETSQLCHWHVPETHYLEAWGDVRAHDGTATILQPLIRPLYNSKSAIELVAALQGQSGRPPLEVVQEHWRADPRFAGDFEGRWQAALHDGLVPGSALPPVPVKARSALDLPAGIGPRPEEGVLDLVLRPDAAVYDGRFANNGWLQETPRPVSKLTWDNAALVSPATAEALQVTNEQVVKLTAGGRSVRAPIWIMPGQAPGLVVLHLGYGRRQVGRVGRGAGFDANLLRGGDSGWHRRGVTAARTFERQPLACTQDHGSMEGRDLARRATLTQYRASPHLEPEGQVYDPALTLYNSTDHQYTGNSWGMAIDLSACIGCNACAVACQAENNIPVVGKDQVLNGREMAWIRVDRYYTDLDAPEILHQPVPCQQCENAPCEVVCPVAATSHSEEGLNDMVYNRCVGTRYCSNNCPYKVRRFNFLQYTDRETESLKLQRNPDVSVRTRGVMEKCTYCTQRINAARVEAKRRHGEIADGAIQTACQQACPTQAIAFGNLNDPNSAVVRWKASPRNYGILTELNTRPRTTYLARIVNPNPEIG